MRSALFLILAGGLSFFQFYAWAQNSDSSPEIDSIFLEYNEQIKNNPHQAVLLSQKALELSLEQKIETSQIKSYYSLGRAYYLTLAMDTAIWHLEKGIALASSVRDTFHLILCKKWTGSAWRHQSKLRPALQAYEEALSLAEALPYDDEIPKITQNIAGIFSDLEQYEQAIVYFKESLDKMEQPSDKIVCNNNLGLCYLRNAQYDLALQAFEESLKLCKNTNDEACETAPLKLIANTYMQLDQYEKALSYGIVALERRRAEGNNQLLVNAYNQVGLIYLNLEEYHNALKHFEECLKLTDYIPPSSLPLLHANLALAFEGLGNYRQAVSHLWKFQELRDSVYNQQNQIQTQELLTKFDTERKEKEILLLQKEKELQESELTRQTLIRNIAITGVIMAVFILLTIRKLYAQIIKTQQELTDKQQEINEQKTKELIRENELKATKANIEGQEQERKRIAQELHDGIAGDLATMKLHLLDLSTKKNPSIDNIINQMDATYDQVRSLSHHLMPPSTQNSTLIELVANYLDELKPRIPFTIDFHYHTKEILDELNANIKHELFRITQELMNNIIKHANPAHVDVQLNVNDNELNLMVEDDGKGFDPAKASNGIGLKSINSRVQKVNGHCHIDSKPNHGTTISIDIPIKTTCKNEV